MNVRIDILMEELLKGDTSFTERPAFGGLFGSITYTQQETKEAWKGGIRMGIEYGLQRATLEGQRIELLNNLEQDPHEDIHRKFLTEFNELAAKYECAIQYHPEHGMVVVDRKPHR